MAHTSTSEIDASASPGETDAEVRFPEDLARVQRCIEGDRGAWGALLRAHEPAIRGAVLHTLRARGVWLGEDALQDMLGDLLVELVGRDFRRLRAYSGRCRLGAWLKVVATHYTIDQLRRRRPLRSLQDEDAAGRALADTLVDPGPSPERALGEAQQAAALWRLMAQLPEEDQRFVELFFVQERPFEEVAAQMGATVGAVYARKNRVRRRLLRLAAQEGLIAAEKV
jgi:RNA polymerase sigma factor (sigma-70 family)